jgi:hypothetical protein
MLLSTVQWQRVHGTHSDLEAVTARIYSCWKYGATNVAPTQRDRPLLRWRGGPILKHVHVQKIFYFLLFLVGWDWVHLVLRPLLAYCTSPNVQKIIKILVMDLLETEARNDCAGKGHQQSVRPTYQSLKNWTRPTWHTPATPSSLIDPSKGESAFNYDLTGNKPHICYEVNSANDVRIMCRCLFWEAIEADRLSLSLSLSYLTLNHVEYTIITAH